MDKIWILIIIFTAPFWLYMVARIVSGACMQSWKEVITKGDKDNDEEK